MVYATVDDLAVIAGDRLLNETDSATAGRLLEYASAILDARFEQQQKEPSDVSATLLKNVVCFMVIRAMDSYNRGNDDTGLMYSSEPFANTGFFNYRGYIKPNASELADLGLSAKHTRAGFSGF